MLTFSPSSHVNCLIICQDDLGSKIKGHFTFLCGNQEGEYDTSTPFLATTGCEQFPSFLPYRKDKKQHDELLTEQA